MLRFRIGDIPRGSRMWWIHEEDIGFKEWDGLDVDGMLLIEQHAKALRALQNKRSNEALAKMLFKKQEIPNGST